MTQYRSIVLFIYIFSLHKWGVCVCAASWPRQAFIKLQYLICYSHFSVIFVSFLIYNIYQDFQIII